MVRIASPPAVLTNPWRPVTDNTGRFFFIPKNCGPFVQKPAGTTVYALREQHHRSPS